jgi:uncharacterized protein YoxC
MNAGQLAALVAAAFFAVGVCAAVYVLAKLARLITAATSMVTSYQAGADELLQRTRAAVERADEQLARTGALADGVDEVAASMSELSEQVAAVAGTARLIASGLGAPVLRLAAAGHGVRRAIAIRRAGRTVAELRANSRTAPVRPLPDRALPDRAVPDRARPGRALADRARR